MSNNDSASAPKSNNALSRESSECGLITGPTPPRRCILCLCDAAWWKMPQPSWLAAAMLARYRRRLRSSSGPKVGRPGATDTAGTPPGTAPAFSAHDQLCPQTQCTSLQPSVFCVGTPHAGHGWMPAASTDRNRRCRSSHETLGCQPLTLHLKHIFWSQHCVFIFGYLRKTASCKVTLLSTSVIRAMSSVSSCHAAGSNWSSGFSFWQRPQEAAALSIEPSSRSASLSPVLKERHATRKSRRKESSPRRNQLKAVSSCLAMSPSFASTSKE
mmetsp:Transcript_82193/g.238297  ORF Transcript_82193/g.238297 Transcript_82193/m.238297 type:complete len:271 (+) Transcript_82193:952-1764(+)